MRTDHDRLLDINEAVQRIIEKLPSAKEEFIRSDLLQVWALYHIQVTGEAANSISAEFQKAHPEIPWKDLIAMRHLLVHQYFGIDLDEVWNTAKQDLPLLKQKITRILEQESYR
ncbi:MAG: HepT-like ribonuclease domain-containing protein [Methanoregula sp.]